LLECIEIKKLWPTHNKAMKRFDTKFGLYEYEARNGYRYLAVGKVSKFQACIEVFSSIHKGISLLRSLAEQFEIDYRFCKYCVSGNDEFFQKDDTTDLPDKKLQNKQIENAISFVLKNRPSFAIIDKGRSVEERSYILVENGHFYGMGYISSDTQIFEPSEIKDYLTAYKNNDYIMQLIYGYVEKYPRKVFQMNE